MEALSTFANRVTGTARKLAREGRGFGDKVFIHRVWADAFQHLELEAFKSLLIQANRAGLLALARADMVELFNPTDISASETRYLSATFNFIEL